MSQIRQLLPAIALSFALGAAVAGGCGYAVWKDTTSFWVSNHYVAVAYDGATRASALTALRHGDADRAIELLEIVLDQDAAALGGFTPTGAPAIDNRVRVLAGSLNAYRREFPSNQSNPELKRLIDRGLAVGGKADAATPPN